MPRAHDRTYESLDLASGITGSDPLSDVLRTIRLRGALFFLADATAPWCVDIPATEAYADIILPAARHVVSYHIAVEGAGLASVPGVDPVPFRAGDIVVFPHGDPYVLANEAGAEPEFDRAGTIGFFRALAAGELPFVIPEGGGGEPRTRMVCGFLGCDLGPFNPLLGALPRVLVIRRPDGAPPDLLDRLTDLAVSEAEHPRPGGEAIRLGLTELMFAELLRRQTQYLPAGAQGWLAGLRDPVVSRAIAQLHASPARDWTLDGLARASGVSRSVLAGRFSATLGQPPMRYLKRWRMQLAAGYLADGNLPVGAVAGKVGFGSEAAFSRAFKQVTGQPPSAWRDAAVT